MNLTERGVMVLVPEEEMNALKSTQEKILQELQQLKAGSKISSVSSTLSSYLTAKEFMSAVKICRSKFDQLVAANQIKSIKKKRKIYVPAAEVSRYFSDPAIG